MLGLNTKDVPDCVFPGGLLLATDVLPSDGAVEDIETDLRPWESSVSAGWLSWGSPVNRSGLEIYEFALKTFITIIVQFDIKLY